ncbi:MAG: response regulator [Nitriliruptorales bacterium]|nr:response regulator [Nitriliruptorales bacterium]
MRVLIAEDDPVIALGLEHKLVALGHEVVGWATDGEAAVDAVERAKPDAVVMDVVMPRVDGLEAARRISERNGVAIVAITAYDDPQLVDRAIAAGVAAYLVKPVDSRQIDSALHLAVRRHAEFAALRAQVDELSDALEARKLVERAKGVLMERSGLSEAEAFGRIQRRARDRNQSMADVAQQILDAAKLFD